MAYRPEIDGMRAFAVAFVIVYHSFPDLLPGGFIGVDIFFVISGYLISSIVFYEINANIFNLSDFYCRRIKRLFPALLILLILTLFYGSFVLLPIEFKNLAKAVIASILYVQNIFLYNENAYFAAESKLKPLLHIWSLSIEEQFYILYPVLISFIISQTTKYKSQKNVLGYFIAIAFLFSLTANIFVSLSNEKASFFLLQYRIWEFCAGASLAFNHFLNRDKNQNPVGSSPKVFLAIGLIIFSCVFFNSSNPYPGWRAVLPVLASLLIIDASKHTPLFKILSNPLILYIGKISYPLYLFHWPALSFVQIILGYAVTPRYILGALLVAILLSIATYELVEKPLRKISSRKIIWSLLGCASLILCMCIAIVYQFFPFKIDSRIMRITDALEDTDMFLGYQKVPGKHNLDIYQFGPTHKKTVFFGDSNMQQYAPRIRKLIESGFSDNRGALFITKTGSIPIPNITNNENSDYDLFNYLKQTLADDPNVDRVVISSLWKVYFRSSSKLKINNALLSTNEGLEEAFQIFKNFLQELVKSGKDVYVISTMPIGHELNPRNAIQRTFYSVQYNQNMLPLPRNIFESRNPLVDKLLKQSVSSAGAKIIDPVDYLTTNGVCDFENESGPIRFDGNHLRPSFVKENAAFLDHTMK